MTTQNPPDHRAVSGNSAVSFVKRPVVQIGATAVLAVAVFGAVAFTTAGHSSTSTTTSSNVGSAYSTAGSGSGSAEGAGGSAPGGAPPGGSGGGSGGGPGSSTQTYTDTGAYTLNGGTASKSGTAFTASGTDESGVLVKGGGVLTLTGVTLSTSGASKSSDESSFYGLNSGLLVYNSGQATINGGTYSTTGLGANTIFAYGSGASIDVSGATVKASGGYSHGLMASGGGKITATDTTVATQSHNSAALATDRGGGTIAFTGGSLYTAGADAPLIYSTGSITATNTTGTATTAEAVVVEGSNSVTLVNSTLTGHKNGAMLYQSFSGDAQVGTSQFTMTGGSLTGVTGDAFLVKNTKATVVLSGGAKISNGSGNLIDATGKGIVTFTAGGETLTGDIVTDSTSSATVILKDGTTLAGKINTAALTLDSTSKWTVTANSTLSTLTGAVISGSEVTNIIGNGHNVYYSKSASANSYLGGKTYTLAGGGQRSRSRGPDVLGGAVATPPASRCGRRRRRGPCRSGRRPRPGRAASPSERGRDRHAPRASRR